LKEKENKKRKFGRPIKPGEGWRLLPAPKPKEKGRKKKKKKAVAPTNVQRKRWERGEGRETLPCSLNSFKEGKRGRGEWRKMFPKIAALEEG